MSVTFGLVGTNPFSDFASQDLEDRIYQYIGDNWGITGVTDLTKADIFRTTVKADMVNQPYQGTKPYWIWVQHFRTTASRTARGSSMGATGYIQHQSTFIIHIFAKRLKPAITFPELGLMAQEVERILFQYAKDTNFAIMGVEHFDNWAMENVREVNNLGESFAGVYEMICGIDAFYHKAST